MLRAIPLLALIAFAYSEYSMGRPLKEEESYVMKSFQSVQLDQLKVITDAKIEHKCVEVDDKGIQHIEARYISGTVRKGNADPEDVKEDYFNYFQNRFGQRFEYEEIRAKVEDDPVNYVVAEMHSKLKDHSVVEGEKWSDKSTNTEYAISAGTVQKLMGTECIQVKRTGTFTNGISGKFKVESWYRTKDGQLMYEETNADDVRVGNLPVIQYLERNELVEK